MADAFSGLLKLQSLRVMRARRELERCQREVAAARQACAQEAARHDEHQALARRIQAEIRTCCLATPVHMAEIQRLLDYAATARHEAAQSAHRLRRLRIVQQRSEQVMAQAWSEYHRCDLRARAVRKHADDCARVDQRQRDARVEEQVLEAHVAHHAGGLV